MVYRPERDKSNPRTMEYRPERDGEFKIEPITPPDYDPYKKTEIQLLSQRKNIKRYKTT
tara:strand:+ start:340 stop:516 length:177 start_codon:yes stop_codon:yes gene_type:complete